MVLDPIYYGRYSVEHGTLQSIDLYTSLMELTSYI